MVSSPEEVVDPVQHRLKVYTKTGDAGSSQLFTSERRPKDDAVFEALGAVDELAAFCGSAREECLLLAGAQSIAEDLEVVLSILLDIGSNIATPLPVEGDQSRSRGGSSRGASWAAKRARTAFDVHGAEAVLALESRIDEITETLPPVRHHELNVHVSCPKPNIFNVALSFQTCQSSS